MAENAKNANLKERPPIVVVMGHVDHGKTTLLDYIRKANVAGREAGGITQAVGAYEIIRPRTDAGIAQTDAEKIPRSSASSPRTSAPSEGRKMTFIDTPGHEAFTKMRSAGATVADLAILIVAADEGLKPQTKEAIKILEETKTPFVVAINKIDKPDASMEKVKNDLTAAGVLLEGYGGNISYHGISAKTGEGVDDLLDLVLLAADMEDLSYDPDAPARGFVLEAAFDHRRGSEIAVILTDGTLRAGDFIATPSARGKVKILENFLGERARELQPSSPALIIGFETPPAVGETFTAAASAEALPAHIAPEPKERQFPPAFEKGVNGKPEVRLILKSADAGSLEALSMIMRNLPGDRPPTILGETVGDITDGDVKSAIASRAILIGFKTKVNAAAKNLAQANGVRIITSEIVYDLVKAVEEFLKGPAAGAISGELEVLAVFSQKKLDKQIIGGKVASGVLRNKAVFDIMRGGETAGEGRIANLQAQKKEVSEVAAGNECGLLVTANVAIAVGDRLVIKR